jgi:hypothetical protein
VFLSERAAEHSATISIISRLCATCGDDKAENQYRVYSTLHPIPYISALLYLGCHLGPQPGTLVNDAADGVLMALLWDGGWSWLFPKRHRGVFLLWCQRPLSLLTAETHEDELLSVGSGVNITPDWGTVCHSGV